LSTCVIFALAGRQTPSANANAVVIQNLAGRKVMKIRKILYSAALTLVVVGLASAQDVTVGGLGVGVVPSNRVILPPKAVFSNCGVGCTSFGNQYWYISGDHASKFPGQTIATQFTWKGTAVFKNAYAANYMDSGTGPIGAAILTNSSAGLPGKILIPLKVTKNSCPGTVGQPCIYKPIKKPPKIKVGTKLWLCLYALKSTDLGGWLESFNDASTAKNFAGNYAGKCVTPQWIQVGASNPRGAFEINGP
jgi:hypothetical protein